MATDKSKTKKKNPFNILKLIRPSKKSPKK